MYLSLLVGVFTAANAFIALFIVVYAFLFLKKTKSHKDRRPWDYLFLASIIYLAYTLFLMLLQIYHVNSILGSGEDVYQLSIFFQFLYTGLILLAFISQTDLIFNNEIIIIMKKHAGEPGAQANGATADLNKAITVAAVEKAVVAGSSQEAEPAKRKPAKKSRKQK